MNEKKINHLYQSLTHSKSRKSKNNENYYVFFKEVYINAHFLTKIAVVLLFIILDLVSIIFSLKFFKNLSINKSVSILKILSKINFLEAAINIIKTYSLIFYFDETK